MLENFYNTASEQPEWFKDKCRKILRCYHKHAQLFLYLWATNLRSGNKICVTQQRRQNSTAALISIPVLYDRFCYLGEEKSRAGKKKDLS